MLSIVKKIFLMLHAIYIKNISYLKFKYLNDNIRLNLKYKCNKMRLDCLIQHIHFATLLC